jgi:hypothetical protein
MVGELARETIQRRGHGAGIAGHHCLSNKASAW